VSRFARRKRVAPAREPEAVGPDLRRIEGLERTLNDHIDALVAQQDELAARAAAVEAGEREIAARLAELQEAMTSVSRREEELRRRSEALEERLRATDGRWRLQDLERLARTAAPNHPDRVPEWQAYLFFLRDFAGADGAIPARFDGLVDEAFQELVR
jgi:DNA repair exonuclease SbcCD ATPase subunit